MGWVASVILMAMAILTNETRHAAKIPNELMGTIGEIPVARNAADVVAVVTSL